MRALAAIECPAGTSVGDGPRGWWSSSATVMQRTTRSVVMECEPLIVVAPETTDPMDRRIGGGYVGTPPMAAQASTGQPGGGVVLVEDLHDLQADSVNGPRWGARCVET